MLRVARDRSLSGHIDACLLSKRRSIITLRFQSSLQPATLDTGFKLSPKGLGNPYTTDSAIQRVLSWYLPSTVLKSIEPQLKQFGDEAISEQVNEWIADAETNQPYVKTRDVFNNRYAYDRLMTSHGWKELEKWGIKNGVVARGYEDEYGPYRRVVQHAFNYIYSASSAVYSCPVSMTSGAARLFQHQTKDLPSSHPFHDLYRRLIARENSWISSQWMTERPGGSDVQNSETVAVHSPLLDKSNDNDGFGRLDEGDWLVSGYKFFCSATDCDVALMLAKTETGKLSLFVAPTKKTVKDEDGAEQLVTNGIRFHRLKMKMGTKELPTAELELKDVRAWRVGALDRGISTIATLLNVTRTHNFVTALSCWRRGMAIAKNFALARTTIDQPLWTFPMHLHLLANMEVKFRALLSLSFFTTTLLSHTDNPLPPSSPSLAHLPTSGSQTTTLLRLLTATTKATTCKLSCQSLQECQEALGGVGYMDEPSQPEFNISRLYRDTAANMTWEGTTNVLASEVVRFLVQGKNLETVRTWMKDVVAMIEDVHARARLEDAWGALCEEVESHRKDITVLLAEAREIMFSFAWIVSGVLFAHDAQRDSDAVALEVARRWILDGEPSIGEFGLRDVVHGNDRVTSKRMAERERVNWDCKIVWGVDLPADAAAGYRVPTTSVENQVQEKI